LPSRSELQIRVEQERYHLLKPVLAPSADLPLDPISPWPIDRRPKLCHALRCSRWIRGCGVQKAEMAQGGNAKPGGGPTLSDYAVQHRGNLICSQIRHQTNDIIERRFGGLWRAYLNITQGDGSGLGHAI
jgi:hypothetical protein